MAIENTYLLGKNITLGCGFDLQAKAPLDSRQTVPAFAGLQALITGNAAYEGMIVYDEETKKTYQAQMIDGVLKFREFGMTEAELKAFIAAETTAAMEFKGAAAALPENPAKGDMYKVTASFKVGDDDAKIGDSIVYDGAQWFLIPSGDDIEDTWRPVTDVDNDATLTFAAGDKLDVAVASNGTITYSHEAIDAPELLAENEQTRTYITDVETDGFGHITGYKTATENVVDTNTTYEFEGQGDETTSVYFQVKASDSEAAEVVYLDAYSKNETDAELVKKVDVETYNAYIAGKAMSDEELKAHAKDYADGLAGNYAEAEHDHVVADITDFEDTVEARITAKGYATTGEVATAQGNAEAKAAELDAALKTELQAEIDADVAVVNKALEDYKTANDVAVAGKVAQSAYDADKATFATKTELENVDKKFENYVTSASYADDKAVIDEAIADRYTKSEADGKFALIADAYNDAEVRGLIGDNAEAIEALEGYVGTFTHATAKTVVEYINAKTDGIATSGNLEALAGRVTANEGDIATIKGDYLKAADIADFETKENVQKVADDLAAYVESNDAALVAETKARTEADAGFETRIAALESNFGDGEGTVEDQIEAAVKAEEDARKEAVNGVQDEVDAVEGRMDTAEGKIAALEAESAKHAIKTEVESALALKADKSVVDAMYTNAQIDNLIAEAKKYADDNDADTKYGIVYDSDNKKIKLVEGGSEVEIDASAFIKDGMISNVTIGEDNDLVITFNTDAGKENIILPLDQLVDIYTGVNGDRVNVTVSSDNKVSADLVAGSISKNYLDDGVQASLAKADTALQSHQDISHLATTEALNGVDAKFANYTNTTDMDAQFELKADKAQVATDIADAVAAETDRATGVENGLAGRIKDLEDNKAGYATTGEVADAVAPKLDTETFNAYIDGKSMSDQELKEYADSVIAGLDVEDAAEDKKVVVAVPEVDGKVAPVKAELDRSYIKDFNYTHHVHLNDKETDGEGYVKVTVNYLSTGADEYDGSLVYDLAIATPHVHDVAVWTINACGGHYGGEGVCHAIYRHPDTGANVHMHDDLDGGDDVNSCSFFFNGNITNALDVFINDKGIGTNKITEVTVERIEELPEFEEYNKVNRFYSAVEVNDYAEVKANANAAAGLAADAQAAAIADAASKYETKGTAQGVVDALKLGETYEAIGAEARAIAAAKTETETQVKALADGAVATNAANIADLFAQMQWGEF